MARIGRNDPCPCGSGKKYKKCCIDKPLVSKADGTVTVMDDQTLQAKTNLEQGYGCFYSGKEEEALQYWQPLWDDYVKDELLSTPLKDFDAHVPSHEFMANWFIEYPMVLQNKIRGDAGCGEQLLQYCDSMLKNGKGIGPELKEQIELARAAALSSLGRSEEADQEYERLSKIYSGSLALYVEWSSHLQTISKDEARKVLELGLKNCPDPSDQEVLEDHLHYLNSLSDN